MNYTVLIVPGLGDSGPQHWQTYWLALMKNAQKLIQKDWNAPNLTDWLATLNTTIATIDGPIVLVAHSLGSILVNHWTTNHYDPKVIAALLVAPADVDSVTHTPEETWNFSPIPLTKLPYPSIVITSSNDPYIAVERATLFAEKWGSSFVDVGLQGHLNTASNLKNWEEGQAIFQKLLTQIKE